MLNQNINPELLQRKPTHMFNGNPVKIFYSTKHGLYATGEIMEGDAKGKWTTVELDKAIRRCFWEDGRFDVCRRCSECNDHYR